MHTPGFSRLVAFVSICSVILSASSTPTYLVGTGTQTARAVPSVPLSGKLKQYNPYDPATIERRGWHALYAGYPRDLSPVPLAAAAHGGSDTSSGTANIDGGNDTGLKSLSLGKNCLTPVTNNDCTNDTTGGLSATLCNIVGRLAGLSSSSGEGSGIDENPIASASDAISSGSGITDRGRATITNATSNISGGGSSSSTLDSISVTVRGATSNTPNGGSGTSIVDSSVSAPSNNSGNGGSGASSGSEAVSADATDSNLVPISGSGISVDSPSVGVPTVCTPIVGCGNIDGTTITDCITASASNTVSNANIGSGIVGGSPITASVSDALPGVIKSTTPVVSIVNGIGESTSEQTSAGKSTVGGVTESVPNAPDFVSGSVNVKGKASKQPRRGEHQKRLPKW